MTVSPIEYNRSDPVSNSDLHFKMAGNFYFLFLMCIPSVKKFKKLQEKPL